MNAEKLAEARDSAEITRQSLMSALASATELESIILLPLITRSAQLLADIDTLRGAIYWTKP